MERIRPIFAACMEVRDEALKWTKFHQRARWPSWSKAHGSGSPDPNIRVSISGREFESHSCHFLHLSFLDPDEFIFLASGHVWSGSGDWPWWIFNSFLVSTVRQDGRVGPRRQVKVHLNTVSWSPQGGVSSSLTLVIFWPGCLFVPVATRWTGSIFNFCPFSLAWPGFCGAVCMVHRKTDRSQCRYLLLHSSDIRPCYILY